MPGCIESALVDVVIERIYVLAAEQHSKNMRNCFVIAYNTYMCGAFVIEECDIIWVSLSLDLPCSLYIFMNISLFIYSMNIIRDVREGQKYIYIYIYIYVCIYTFMSRTHVCFSGKGLYTCQL